MADGSPFEDAYTAEQLAEIMKREPPPRIVPRPRGGVYVLDSVEENGPVDRVARYSACY